MVAQHARQHLSALHAILPTSFKFQDRFVRVKQVKSIYPQTQHAVAAQRLLLTVNNVAQHLFVHYV
jgi:hypothetical protein